MTSTLTSDQVIRQLSATSNVKQIHQILIDYEKKSFDDSYALGYQHGYFDAHSNTPMT